jgi:hypothetical protein
MPPSLSLDVDEAKEGLEWYATGPPEFCDLEVVQQNIAYGVRCSKMELARTKSELLLELLRGMKEDGTNRIYILPSTFSSGCLMKRFFHWMFDDDSSVLTTEDRVQLIHAANALDIRGSSRVVGLVYNVLARHDSMSAEERIQFGRRYHQTGMVKSGSELLLKQFMDNYKLKGTHLSIPDHLLAICAPIWLETIALMNGVPKGGDSSSSDSDSDSD